MADKLMYPLGSFKYGTRRLVAGDDPVLMNARDQRLYTALGKATAEKPSRGKRAVGEALLAAEDTPMVKPKTATRKRTTRKKAVAKKKNA